MNVERSAPWVRRLKFRHLEMLMMLGRTGSFGKAAELCGLSQPALSKWVKDLESTLGVTLFERSTRRVVLTDCGQLVMYHAERVLTDMTRLQGQLEAQRSGEAGRLQIGVLAALGPVLMPGILARIQRDGFSLELELLEGTMDHLLPLLSERKLDLVIGRLTTINYEESLSRRLLYEDTLCVAGTTSHPLARRGKPVSWQDACAYPWIMPPAESPIRGMFENTLAQEGLPRPRIVLESASVLTNYHVARRLDCLFATSEKVIHLFAEQGLLQQIPLFFASVPATIGMLWSDTPSPLLERFMVLLEEEVQKAM